MGPTEAVHADQATAQQPGIAPAVEGNLRQAMQPRQVAGKTGNDDPLGARPNDIRQPVLHRRFRAAGATARGVGRITDQHIHALPADRPQPPFRRQLAHQRLGIELPVAAVIDTFAGHLEQDAMGLGNRMSDRDPLGLEGAQPNRLQRPDLAQWRPFQVLRQLVADQPGGKGAGVQRATQLAPQVGDRTNMVLVTVGDQQRAELDVVLLQRFEQRHGDAIFPAGRGLQGKAAIDGDPLAAGPIQVQVGPEHPGTPQGDEKRAGLAVQLIKTRCGHAASRQGFPYSLAGPLSRRTSNTPRWP